MARTALTSNVIYYVAPTGSDATGDGSAGNPWATPSHAYSVVQRGIDLCGYKITVQLQGGLAGPFGFSGPLVGQVVPSDFEIYGDDTTWPSPANYVVSATGAGAILFYVDNGARFSVRGMTLRSPGGFGIAVAEGSVQVRNVWFGTMGGAGLDACGPNSIITGKDNLVWLFENTRAGAIAEDHGQINLPCAMIISGAPNFSLAFVQADLGGMVDASGGSVAPGSASGPRYHAFTNGIIQSGGVIFPGSVAGSTSTGGVYQ